MMIQTLDRQTEDSEIFSIGAYRVAELNALFWQQEESKRNNIVAFSRVGSAVAVTTLISFGTPVLAGGGGGGGAGNAGGAADAASAAAAQSISTGVTNAINMITAVNGIGGAAYGVALAPLGFMLTLRILNMVLSRV
jgi:hypothetical protein